MRLRVDLHMHSCLSPCGDGEMSPNNLVNMAWLKGLDAIAVADHNRAANLAACAQVAGRRGLVFVPALEVTSSEEVHLLCYFPVMDAALAFDAWLYERLPPILNRPLFFGEQTMMDALDCPIGSEPRLLMQAADAPLGEIAQRVQALEGVVVPAHINRGANSMLGVLGMFPTDVRFSAVEVSPGAPPPAVDLSSYRVIHGSDAHRLEDIAEPGFLLEANERSAAAIVSALREGHFA